LLHEKPFHGVNGSGKHNNFSVATDAGLNLFGPATDDDFLFLLSVCGLIRAADVYADLLRLSAASPSNDQRLGGYEAPPPILSVFLGENLLGRLLEVDRPEQSPEPFPIVPSLPDLQIDDSDRNRTSPFAFTGNKFEFRMLGSSQNVAVSNTFLNTAMADSFAVFAERLEAAQDKDAEKRKIIAETMAQHGRVVFNGDNYSKAWVAEAKKRKLPIISNTVDAADALLEEKNLVLFEKFSVLTREEAVARYEVILEGYVKTISIEADTVVQMVKRSIIPAVTVELGKRAQALNQLVTAGIANKGLTESVKNFNASVEAIIARLAELETAIAEAKPEAKIRAQAVYQRDSILPKMEKLREVVDATEASMSPDNWPFPSYAALFYSL
jgi:glutamine synthetase